MASVTFNGSRGSSNFDLPAPDVGTPDHIIVRINIPAPAARPEAAASPSLCSRMVRGLFNHSGKIALIASALILTSQTEAGTKILADATNQAAKFAAENYEPIKTTLIQTANEAIKFGKDNLPDINAALSLIWAVPNAFRAGSKKMGAFWLLAGAASAATPYALKPGFTFQGALDSATKLGTTALAFLQRTSPFKGDL